MTPEPPARPAVNDDLVVPVIGQSLVLLLLLGVADGGRLARAWLVSSAVFTTAAGLLVASTRGRPARAGRLFVMLGWLVLVPAGMYALLRS
ncbi:MAG: hypothetical protein K2X82_18635 [Gemmataceae bacterium]|nr:hypothetical protein [Gemmataceae bacterium]